MAMTNARSAVVLNVQPLGTNLATTATKTLITTNSLEVIRLVVPAGKAIPIHRATNEITVQCLEGRVAFTADGKSYELAAGNLIHLGACVPHAIKGIEDASLLLTRLLPKTERTEALDVVQEASEESFPASDSPAY